MNNIFTRTFFLLFLLLTTGSIFSENHYFTHQVSDNISDFHNSFIVSALDETNLSQTMLAAPGDVAELAITIDGPAAAPTINNSSVVTITVTNSGPDAATDFSVSVSVPDGLTLLSSSAYTGAFDASTGVWTIPGLNMGESAVLDLTLEVEPTGAYTLSANITGVVETDDAANNSASVNLEPEANLGIEVVASNDTPNVGDDITFTLTASNGGPSDASGVVVNAALPDGYTIDYHTGGTNYSSNTWTVGYLTTGASTQMAITASVNTSGAYGFNAVIAGEQADPDNGNNSVTNTPAPTSITDLALTMAVNNGTPNVGSNVEFTITATNGGPSEASGVAVTAALPTGYTYVSHSGAGSYVEGTGAWAVGSITSGDDAAMTITATVNPTGNHNFEGTITGGQTDPVPGNNSTNASTTPTPVTDLGITMAVNNATPNVGSNVVFTLTATNGGPSNAAGVVVTAALPTGYTYVSHTGGASYTPGTGAWAVGSLTSGSNSAMTITATVNPTGNHNFEGTITGGQTDPVPGNNSTSASTTPTPVTDLGITMAVNNSNPNVGTDVVFTITATNGGPSNATGVAVTATLPTGYTYVSHTGGASYATGTGIWTVGSLTSGSNSAMTITATVNPSGTYTFSGTISGGQTDPIAGNNSASVSPSSSAVADLALTMAVNNATPNVGGNVTFTITATNGGPSNATGVVVTAALPTGYTYVSHTGGASYIPGTGVWTVGSLTSGSNSAITITATVNPPGNQTFNGSITGNQNDLSTGNNNAQISVTPQQSDLQITVSSSVPNPQIAQAVTITITVTNNGPNNASGVAVDATIPSGYSNITDITSSGVLIGSTIKWNNKTLNNGANLLLTFKATTNPPQQVTNEYRINALISASNQYDPVAGNNSTSITLNLSNTPPVAYNDAAATNEDTPLTVNAANGVLSNDTDINGDALSVTLFTVNGTTRPAGTELTFAQGKLTIQSNGSFTFTPALNFNGAVPDITYTVSDGIATDTGILKITVHPINDSPVANDDYVYTAEGTPVNYNVLANDNDLADAPAGGLNINTLKITQHPSHGTLTILPNKQINYSPYAGFYGSDEAEYEICDLGHPGSLCSRAKIFFSVTRRSPIANDDTAETDEDEAVLINILSNDDDTDINPATVVIIAQPQNGTATYQGNGIVHYMPGKDYNGSDFFTYTVTDMTNLTSNVARVDITIHPVDDAPVATDGLYSTRENQSVVIPISERVSDPDDNIDWSSISIVVQPANGQVTSGPGAGNLRYTPSTNFYGTDAFQFTIKDLTNLTSNAATISIQVSDQAPTAEDDVATTNEDQAVVVTVLNNDTDPQNNINPGSVTITIAPLNGSAIPNANGTIIYTPNPDYYGGDTFFYTVCDETEYCDEAKVTITINPVNDAPVAVNDAVTLLEDTPVLIRVLNNDYDVDNSNDELTLTIKTQPQHGTAQLVLEPIGILYTPDENYSGTDHFAYRITDPDGLWDEATVNLTITWVNDAPSPANDQYGPISMAGATLNVLANDSDPDDNLDPSSLTIVVAPTHGTATPNSNGTVFYLPNDDFFGNDSFIYQICDTEGACAQAEVSLSVIAGNGPPQANNDLYTLLEDQPFLFNPLGNDTDPNNNIDPSTLRIVQAPQNGALEFVGTDGSLRYTPTQDYNGSDSFIYEICDNGVPVYCDQATVSFTINPVNDAPRPQPDFVDTYDMTIVTTHVLANDAEPEGETMTASLITNSPSALGEFFLTEDGEFTYEAYPGTYCTTDTVYYRVCDPHDACAGSYIVIDIRPLDTDEDGIPDYLEKNLHLLNGDPMAHHSITEWPDTDGDGTPDYLSTDSDGDGISDAIESGMTDACVDLPRDTNGNGTPDYRDLDSDGDGVPDSQEGTGDCDNDGIPNYIDPFDDCSDRLNVPSTFSPNGDGVNDYWIIQGVTDFPDSELSIFNRWGNLVYQKAPYDNSWDGRASSSVFGSDELPEGIYYYILKMDEKLYKGSVYIKK